MIIKVNKFVEYDSQISHLDDCVIILSPTLTNKQITNNVSKIKQNSINYDYDKKNMT